MTTPKLSPWFPPHIKPVRVGAYSARIATTTWLYAYWDGSYWGFLASSPLNAFVCRHSMCVGTANQAKSWRGLARKP